jgi:hypothetical protein
MFSRDDRLDYFLFHTGGVREYLQSVAKEQVPFREPALRVLRVRIKGKLREEEERRPTNERNARKARRTVRNMRNEMRETSVIQ